MLIRYAAENYRSIRTRQEFSFVAGAYKEHPEFVANVESLKLGVLRVAAIYGPNASGKSNVLLALKYFRSAVLYSYRNWEPDGGVKTPKFQLNRSQDKPSTFEIDFILGGIRFEYGFSARLKEITDEWLHAYPSGKKNTWFRRHKTEYRFGRALKGDNSKIKRLTRTNSLFLSAAAQNNHKQLLAVYEWFNTRLLFISGDRGELVFDAVRDSLSSPETRERIVSYLKQADLGIVGLKMDSRKMRKTPDFKEFVAAMQNALGQSVRPREREISDITFAHQGIRKTVDLGLHDESEGTKAYLVLISKALLALAHGSVLIVDELDASLHPLLALEVVRLFNDPEINRNSAQLLFNTHDTNLLNLKYLRRDQIWFTEKSAAGETHLYPLSDFKSRNDENLEKGYLQGRFGAVPFFSNAAHDLLSSDGQK